MKHIIISVFGLLVLTSSEVKIKEIDQNKVVELHNIYRREVKVPNLEYSEECAAYAQRWAKYLAQKNKGLNHSNSNKYGENIYWCSAEASETKMVDSWVKEKKLFSTKSRKHNSKNGHYTQVIWKDTKFVGAGMAVAKDGSEYWVCTYYPAGNYIGEKVY
jgi:pathogenesis-related protein 1